MLCAKNDLNLGVILFFNLHVFLQMLFRSISLVLIQVEHQNFRSNSNPLKLEISPNSH